MIEAIWNSLPKKVIRWLDYVDKISISLFICCAIIFMILQNGIWVIPNIEVLRLMASDITRNMLATIHEARGEYLYSSFFGLAFAWFTGAYKNTTAFAAMHLLAFIVGTTAIALFFVRKFGVESAKIFLIALACGPLSNVLLNWLGISDVFTYIFATIVVVSESLPVLYLATLFLGISHMEQGIVIALIAASKIWLIEDTSKSNKIKRIVTVVAGIICAKIFFLIYFDIMNFHLTFSRASFAKPEFAYLFIIGFVRNLPVTIYAFYSSAWILVGFTIGFAIKARDRRLLAFMIISNSLAAITSAMVYDSTRDFSLIIWPSFIATLLYVLKRANKDDSRRASLLALAACFVLPKIIVWEGKMQSSAIIYDILFVLEKITHKNLIARLDFIHIAWPFAY